MKGIEEKDQELNRPSLERKLEEQEEWAGLVFGELNSEQKSKPT